jgi:hypothetical protein
MAVRYLWALLSALASCPTLASPTPVWEVPFGGSGRPDLVYNEAPAVVSDAAGEAFTLHNFGRSSQLMIARVSASADTAWSAATAFSSTEGTRALPLSGGALIVASEELQYFEADGRRRWSTRWKTRFDPPVVLEVGDQLVVLDIGGEAPVTRIDVHSGRVIEQVGAGMFGTCDRAFGAVAGEDTLYLVARGDLGCGQLAKVRLDPLRIEWVASPPEDGAVPLALTADSSGAYVTHATHTLRRLDKRSSTDGNVLWSAAVPLPASPMSPDPRGAFIDTDGDVIVHAGQVIEKIDRHSGATRWRHATAGGFFVGVALSSDAIVVVRSDDTTQGLTPLPGDVLRLRRSDGVALWQSPLAPPDGHVARVTGVAVGKGGILAAGISCAGDTQSHQCRLVAWPVTLDGVVAAVRQPVVELPTFIGHAIRAGAGTTMAAVLQSGAHGQEVRVRRLRNTDGAILWDSVRPTRLDGVMGRNADTLAVAVSDRDDTVAVLYGVRVGSTIPPTGDAVLTVFDGETGAWRWQRSVIDRRAGYTSGHAYTLAVDRAGNVFVPLHEAIPESFPTPYVPNRRQIRKYAASNGAQVLSIDFPLSGDGAVHYYAPPFLRGIEDDLLTTEVPGTTSRYALARLSGVDGRVLWSNPAAEVSFLHDGDAVNQYGLGAGATASVSAYALATGLAAWRVAYVDPADRDYALFAFHRGSDNAVYAGGYRRVPRPGSTTATDRKAMLMRIGVDDGVLTWVNRLDQGPVKSNDDRLEPVHDRNGIVYSWQRQARSSQSSARFLTGLSTADGEPRGIQWVYSTNGAPIGTVAITDNLAVIDTSADGGLIASANRISPGRPARFTLMKLPAPGLHAGGSLRVSLSAAITRMANGARVSFTFDAVNDGALAAVDVDALLEFPASSITEAVSCIGASGEPCQPALTATSLGVRHHIAAGARVRITGALNIHAPYLDDLKLEASAFAPYGFVEMDMKDNIRSLRVDDILFIHGFD